MEGPTVEIVIHAIITSWLDYCNSLYLGLAYANLSCLQMVQNAAARLLTGTKNRQHITPILWSRSLKFSCLYISVLPPVLLGHLLTLFCRYLIHTSKLKVAMPFPLLPLSSGTVSHCTSDPHPHWADWSLIFILLHLV